MIEFTNAHHCYGGFTPIQQTLQRGDLFNYRTSED
jgi:hypothetical protein